jgi:dihydrodipicolinate synthase/N-acetylneuraminate lyase
MSEFHGVLPALFTPFTEDGAAIDVEALEAGVERLVGAGVGGLVPGGSTGEFTTLTTAERKLLVETVVRAADGRVPVVAGTAALSTAETVALSVHAEQAGAAAVMIIPPFYDVPTWRELKAHFQAVADAISIPVMYYNLPGVSSFAQTLIQGDGPTLLNGYDTHTFHALASGVQAVVWGVASVLPEQCVELHRLLIDDIDLPSARALWARLWAVCDVLESVPYAAGVKAGARVNGFTTGPVRGPLLELEDADRARLAAVVEAALGAEAVR